MPSPFPLDRTLLSQLHTLWNLSEGTESKEGGWASAPTPDGMGTFEYLDKPVPLSDDTGALPNPDPRLGATPKAPAPVEYSGPNPVEDQPVPAGIDKKAVQASKKMVVQASVFWSRARTSSGSGRGAVTQPVSTRSSPMTQKPAGAPGAGLDVVEILTTDHAEMIALLTEARATPDVDRRRDLVDTVIAEVMRHAVAEEMYVYPAIEKHVPDGAREVEEDKREHQTIVEVMKQLEAADASDPAFQSGLERLLELLRHHATGEESRQFPSLRRHIDAAALVEMGEKVEKAKRLAPTRPHPSAPHSALFHKTVGPGVGMIDRLRDALTGRQTG